MKKGKHAVLWTVGTLFCWHAALADEHVGSTSQPLTSSTEARLWTENANVIPVCFETNGYLEEKKIMRDAVVNSWQLFANIEFRGWGLCRSDNNEQWVRIRISPQGPENAGSGGSARVGMAALSKALDNDPGVNITINASSYAQTRLEYVAVHEFGHVLGFIHEQDTPGNEAGVGYCATSGADPHADPVTGYDRDSIMNYCNRDGNMTGNLTDIDIEGVQKIYGARIKNEPATNFCSSTLLRKRVTLAAPWNDAGAASIALFPNDGTRFLYHSQWSIRDGGWMDNAKWVAGDFNGDGRSDLAAVWNYGGQNVLTVRTADAQNKFHQAHWLVGGGGWMDSTQWFAGDFNGDGKDDLAAVWNNGGKVSIAVYLSDGTKFLYHTQWADRDGGWAPSIKWMSGDFNGDGKADIGAAWNNEGRTTLTVRLSTGHSFTHEHWLKDAGRWANSSAFYAGDFNGDGKADIAEIWNDISQTSFSVALSSGRSFGAMNSWATRDGGWGNTWLKWFVGDFNGDGKTDIGAVWNNSGTNVLTIRKSNGAGFAQQHWSTNAGGWSPTTDWCVGSF